MLRHLSRWTALLTQSPYPFMFPALVLIHILYDVASLLLSAGPSGPASWTTDHHGIPYGLQQSQHLTHCIFPGGIGLAFYTLGILEFMCQRYGKECLRGSDFHGASSGSWCAFLAAIATHGDISISEGFMKLFLPVLYLVDLFSCGLLFMSDEAIRLSAEFTMDVAKHFASSSRDAIRNRGSLAIWLFGFSLRCSHGAAHRFVASAGPDFKDSASIANIIAATSAFPLFTNPRLCSSVHCMDACMDGWFPGRGVPMLPTPDMTVGSSGRFLVFDVSGGLEKTYAQRDEVHVLSIRDWDSFSFADYTASSPEAVQALFARGLRDAESHTEELDAAMRTVFGNEPREPAHLCKHDVSARHSNVGAKNAGVASAM
eukprot:TRINITY_DN23050_c0_g1_i2.p1 TRINITY_DN23050_c0_g1~~TRINITY_DN23050_c0_g1_i2.p1  ORF type:complete len:372 (-),score=31.82 TRINITY_DN23050_c0_g1_i2:268-1383(-)